MRKVGSPRMALLAPVDVRAAMRRLLVREIQRTFPLTKTRPGNGCRGHRWGQRPAAVIKCPRRKKNRMDSERSSKREETAATRTV